jgi:hypothetical protein
MKSSQSIISQLIFPNMERYYQHLCQVAEKLLFMMSEETGT